MTMCFPNEPDELDRIQREARYIDSIITALNPRSPRAHNSGGGVHVNYLGSSALIVLALAISPTSALPKPVTLSYSAGRSASHPAASSAQTIGSKSAAIGEPMLSGYPRAGIKTRPSSQWVGPSSGPILSDAQKQALVTAYQMGAHYGIPYTFAAVVFIESSGCRTQAGEREHGDYSSDTPGTDEEKRNFRNYNRSKP